MKRRRKRNNNETKIYMGMSIICLVILFAGYSYVYKLSESRKTGQEVTTISITYDGKDVKEKYNKFFDRLMSYFNIFFEETFKTNDDGKIIENKDEEKEKTVYKMINSEDENVAELEAFSEEDYNYSQLVDKEVYMANNRKDDFFKVIESLTFPSRSGILRDIKVDSGMINKNTNIVLFHTHGTEAYLPYVESNYRTKDENYNVMGMGSIITSNLENYGLNIKHLKDFNDYPDYNASYSNSRKNVEAVLDKNKKNLILDLHRDGADENSSYEEFLSRVSTVKINGKTAATFTLVIGNKNENLQELKEIAQIVYDTANEIYPNFCRKIVIREGAYFNQYLSDYALLMELGSTMNTIEEAKYSADLISEILCKTIVEINN